MRSTPSDRLTGSLGVWSATAVVVGTIIGAGIYRVPATVASQSGSVWMLFTLWGLGGLIAIAGALSLAELGAMFPRAGGIYVFMKETYGPMAAFLFGWGMLVVNPAAYAAVAVIFAEAVATIAPMAQSGIRYVAAGMILVLVLINYRSVRFGAAVQNASTAAKVAVLVGLSMLGLIVGGTADGAGTTERVALGAGSFGAGLIAVVFAYDGWQWLPQLAAEVKEPTRTIPRAMGGGVLLIVVVYFLVNAANVRVLGMEGVASSTLVTGDVATHLLGAVGASVVAALIALSTFSSNNGGFMTDPRVFFAMADDGLFFRSVASVHGRFGTPHVAIILTGGVAMIYVFVSTFERMAATLILGMWPFLALSAWSVIRLRRGRPEMARPFRVPLYPLLPAFFLAACAFLFADSLLNAPAMTLINFAILGAGIPVFLVWRTIRLRVA
jgi:amino acid transporter